MGEVIIPEKIQIKFVTFDKEYKINNNDQYLNEFKYFISFCKYNAFALYDNKSFGYHLWVATKNIIAGSNYTEYKDPAIKNILEKNNIDPEEIYNEYIKGLNIL